MRVDKQVNKRFAADNDQAAREWTKEMSLLSADEIVDDEIAMQLFLWPVENPAVHDRTVPKALD